MASKHKSIYKGIAVFGAPGTGKTTIARALLAEITDGQYIEASHSVIHLAVAFKEKLPAQETRFISLIGKVYGKSFNKKVLREEARNFFIYLKNKYSSTVIAKTLIYIHQKKFKNKFLIIAGIRGYKNSIYLKNNGYLVIYLKTPDGHSINRLAKRESFSKKSAELEREIEERIFSTNKVEKVAHLSFNTAGLSKKEVVSQVKALIDNQECRRCVNSGINLSSTIGKSGLCEVCEKYESNFSKKHLEKELKLLLSLKGTGKNKYDAMVGISGGKDSTATLYEVKCMGFTPLAFSLNTGYYPKHIFKRAKAVAKKLDVDYVEIDVRKYIRPVDRLSFKKTAELYSQKESQELREKFRRWYTEGRRHYSIKCEHVIPFVRTCQLCRRIVVRAYFGEAVKRGIPAVIIGINEWAGLSQDAESKKFVFSAIRKLQPFKNKHAVYVVHLPFLLQRKIKDTNRILKKLGWKIPKGEALIESNSNSCLFARAAENKARRLLGFHPDTTRLAREVTVGFISKEQARKALLKIHNSQDSVWGVLKKARVI